VYETDLLTGNASAAKCRPGIFLHAAIGEHDIEIVRAQARQQFTQ
jgi:hypothetical protein